MFQHKHYTLLAVLTNFGIPLAIGYMSGDVWGVFLLAGLLRLVISHHFTFSSIRGRTSAAHNLIPTKIRRGTTL